MESYNVQNYFYIKISIYYDYKMHNLKTHNYFFMSFIYSKFKKKLIFHLLTTYLVKVKYLCK